MKEEKIRKSFKNENSSGGSKKVPFFIYLKIHFPALNVFCWFVTVALYFMLLPQLQGQVQADSLREEPPKDSVALMQPERVKVFLDCNSCDNTYIRQQIDFVSYVRDPQLAQVHLFITAQETASGGRTFTLSFIGKKDFDGINNKLTYTSPLINSKDEERNGLNTIIQLGLVPYVAHTSLVNQLSLTFSGLPPEPPAPVEDPWRNWIFEVYGGFNFSKETSVSSLDIRYGIFADHVTEKWRVRLRPYFNYNRRDFIKDQQEIRSVLHRDGFNGKAVRSISSHWSAGIFTNVISNTYRNIDMGYRIAPAIEYSLLPYKQALRKEITLAYTIGLLHRKYLEETIYGEQQESLANQALELGVRIRQPWGSLRVQLEGSHFLHDFSKNRFSFDGNLSMRVFQGLSVNISSEIDVIQDQLSLPKGDASLEDILLQQRQLATSYEISLSMGVSYSFGSIYNNVVNTRL